MRCCRMRRHGRATYSSTTGLLIRIPIRNRCITETNSTSLYTQVRQTLPYTGEAHFLTVYQSQQSLLVTSSSSLPSTLKNNMIVIQPLFRVAIIQGLVLVQGGHYSGVGPCSGWPIFRGWSLFRVATIQGLVLVQGGHYSGVGPCSAWPLFRGWPLFSMATIQGFVHVQGDHYSGVCPCSAWSLFRGLSMFRVATIQGFVLVQGGHFSGWPLLRVATIQGLALVQGGHYSGVIPCSGWPLFRGFTIYQALQSLLAVRLPPFTTNYQDTHTHPPAML